MHLFAVTIEIYRERAQVPLICIANVRPTEAQFASEVPPLMQKSDVHRCVISREANSTFNFIDTTTKATNLRKNKERDKRIK